MENKELIELIRLVIDETNKAKPKLYNPFEMPLRSEAQDKFLPAYCKMQGEIKSVTANKTNPAYGSKYADLDAILDSVKPTLSANGFSLIPEEEHFEGETYLRITLAHNSCQYRSSFVKITPDRNNNQGYGGGLTYKKRYSCATILGITVSNDPTDDDGEYGKNDKPQNRPQRNENKNTNKPYQQTKKLLAPSEIEYIRDTIGKYTMIEETIVKTYNVKKLEDCPKEYFDRICELVQKTIAKITSS